MARIIIEINDGKRLELNCRVETSDSGGELADKVAKEVAAGMGGYVVIKVRESLNKQSRGKKNVH